MANKLVTIMKMVLVFVDGELYRQIPYKTKAMAKRNYSHFLKYGITDPSTGEVVKNATFELL